MKYLLVEPATQARAYNIALMKYARWCEDNGHEYQYVRGMVKPDIVPDKILMSCIFTYYSKKYEKTIDYYLKMFPKASVLVGGVFPSLFPDWFDKSKWNNPLMDERVKVHRFIDSNIEDLIPKWNVDVKDEDLFKSENMKKKAEARYNQIVMYASRGCVNKCGYCAVPKLEGDMNSFRSIRKFIDTGMKELPDAKSIVLYDNNFTEHAYFDDICDELRDSGLPVDIHGLHVDAFTREKAKKMAELTYGSQGKKQSTAYLRFSFDKMKYKDNVHRALRYVQEADIKASFFCYLLFNWIDSPLDFWKRIVYSQVMVDDVQRDIYLFPQRYEPFDALEKYQYVGKHWTQQLAKGARRTATWLHGFLPVTRSHNIYNWIGYDYEEFLNTLNHMGENSKNRLEKRKGTPPTTEELVEDVSSRDN